MSTQRRIANRLFAALGPAFFLCLMVYFSYHAVEGRHGLLALRAYQSAIPQLTAEAEALAAHRARLEHHVGLLQPRHIDSDYLEELARARLGFVHPNDLIVKLPQAKPLSSNY